MFRMLDRPERQITKLTSGMRLFVHRRARARIMSYGVKAVLRYVGPWYGKYYEPGRY